MRIGIRRNASGAVDQIRQPFILPDQGITSGESDLSGDGHLTLFLITRAAANLHDIIRFQQEARIPVYHEAVLQRESIHLADFTRRLGALRILQAARNIDLDRRGSLQQTSGLENQILERRILGIGVCPGASHKSADRKGPALLQFVNARNNQHVIAAQGHIGTAAIQNSLQIERKNLQRQVVHFAEQLDSGKECVVHYAVGPFDQLADCLDASAEFVHARTVNRTAHLDTVGETIKRGVYRHGIPVLEPIRGELPGRDIEQLMFTTRFTNQAYFLGIGISRKAAGIIDQRPERFVALHLIVHRTLHITIDADEQFVGRNNDHIALLETDVVRKPPVEDILIEIHRGVLLAAAHDPHVAQRTDIRHASGLVEGMEYRGERREPVRSGSGDLAHDVDLDRADLTQRHPHVGDGLIARDPGIFLGKDSTDLVVGLTDGQPVQIDGADLRHHDIAFGRNLLPDIVFVDAPDVDDDLIPGAEFIILGSRQILIRFEGQRPPGKDVVAEDPASSGSTLRGIAHRGAHGIEAAGRRLLGSVAPALLALAADGLIYNGGLTSLAGFVPGTDAFDLALCNAFGQQLLSNLRLTLSGAHARFHIGDHLLIGHLRPNRGDTDNQSQ